MADEDINDDKESGEKSDNKKRKGRLLKFILIPVILIAQAVGAYFLVFNVLLEHPNKKGARNSTNLEVGYFFVLADIVVNPASTSGRRYLVMEIGLEAKEEKLITEAESKEIWFRDAINTLLTNKTDVELLDVSKRSLLKKEILKLINSRMKKGEFSKVYFKKYIMQ